MNNIFREFNKTITREDIASIESKLNYSFPEEMISHYLKYNGGIPDRSWWMGDDEFEPIEVAIFKPFKYNKLTNDEQLSLIDGCYDSMVNRNVIPKNLIPFANDWGGNFFCLNKNDDSIVFYATDAFDEDLAMEDNHINAQRILTSSFNLFVNGLVTEDDLD